MATEIKKVIKVEADESVKTIASLRKEMKDLRDALLNLEKGTDEYNDTLDQLASKEKEVKSVMNATKTDIELPKGSIASMRKEISELAKQWSLASNDIERAKIGEKLKKLREDVRNAEMGVGQFGSNVGNYAESVTNALGSMGGSFTALINPINNVKGAFTALMAHPIVATIAAIVTVIMSLINALKSSEEGTYALNKAFASFKPIVDIVKNAMVDLGKAIVPVVQGIADAVNWVGQALGLSGQIEKLTETEQNIVENTNKLNIRKREITKENADLENQIAEQQAIVEDKLGKSVAQRKKAQEKVDKLQKKLIDNEKEIAQLEYNIQKDRNSTGDSTTEELQKEADLYATLTSIEGKYSKQKTDNTKKQNELTEQGMQITKEANSQRLSAEKQLISEQIKLTAKGTKERLNLEKKEREIEYQLAVSNAQNSIKDQKALNDTLKALKEGYLNDIATIERNIRLELYQEELKNLEVENETRLKGTKEYYDALIEIAEKKKEIASIRLDGESDADYASRNISADKGIITAIIAKNDFQSKQTSLAIENDMKQYSENSEEYKNLMVQLKEEELNAVHKLEEESEEEFRSRLLDKEKELAKAKEEAKQAVIDESQRKIDNDATEELINNGETTKYYELRLQAEIQYRDSLFQLQDETNEEFRQRQLDADKRVSDAQKDLLEKRVGDFSDYATAINNLLNTITIAKQEQIEQDLKNGKISEKEAKKQFEKNKKQQIAVSIISTLTGAIMAFMKAKEVYLPPASYIIGAMDAATTLATGYANINKIKSTNIGSSSISDSGLGNGGQTNVNTPTIEAFQVKNSPRIEENDLKNIQTDEIVSSIQSQRVYVVESDITDEQDKNKVRVAETSW